MLQMVCELIKQHIYIYIYSNIYLFRNIYTACPSDCDECHMENGSIVCDDCIPGKFMSKETCAT